MGYYDQATMIAYKLGPWSDKHDAGLPGYRVARKQKRKRNIPGTLMGLLMAIFV